MSPSVFLINKGYPCLGATPDGAVYDPSYTQQPFGFLEIKCPYVHRNCKPAEACGTSTFCCDLASTTGELRIKERHHYYTQIQGQMAIGERPWCDFVIYTTKGVSVQRVLFNIKFDL